MRRAWRAAKLAYTAEQIRSRTISPDPLAASPVSDLLLGRLDEAERRLVEDSLSERQRELHDSAPAGERSRLLLVLGVHNEVPQLLAKTGLTNAAPPDQVHAMSRGELSAGGTPYYADLVIDALAPALQPRDGMRALDFGCSSGRVVRVLAAAYPGIEWHGCDPIPGAIEWAGANIDGVAFLQSPQQPPLPYPVAGFDFVFAISIWSHYAERAALDWFDEMQRLIKPGGMLAITTHGYNSIAHNLNSGDRGLEQLVAIEKSLYQTGFWFRDEFGEQGDHGVGGGDWGNAFFSQEWLLSKICPPWELVNFAPGRAENNQDLYVLRRAGV